MVCGDGPDEARLRRLARESGVADRVHFRGRVPATEIPLYLRAASLFALYSSYEGMPHAVLEAMAAGVAVVSDRGGNVEAVRDGETGVVVPWSNPTRLAIAVEWLLRDHRRRRELAANARRYVEERLTGPRLVDQTLALFEQARVLRFAR